MSLAVARSKAPSTRKGGAAGLLNEFCLGRTLSQLHEEVLRQLKETHRDMNQAMLDAIAVAQRVFTGQEEQEPADAPASNRLYRPRRSIAIAASACPVRGWVGRTAASAIELRQALARR